jgi:lysophospholipase L1-like esterase
MGMKRLLYGLFVLLGLLLWAVPAHAQTYVPVNGWCQDGNQPIRVSGIASTNPAQASYPLCTLTVLIHGGGAATIYSDSSGTPLANPFTANANGSWQFWVLVGTYDVTMTGGTPALPGPVTFSFTTASGSGGGGSSFYQTVQANGVAVTQEPKLNLLGGPGIATTCADDAGSTRSNCTITETASAVIQSGLMGEYRMLASENPCALVDYSGNGRNATGCIGVSPTIIASSGGVNFVGTGAISLPAALNSALTIQVFMEFQPASLSSQQMSPIMGNGNGTTSNWTGIIFDRTNAGSNPITNNYRTWAYSNNAVYAAPLTVMAGTNTVSLTMDTQDHLYYGTQENSLYIGSVLSSAGLQTVGNYQIGGAAAGSGLAASSYLTGKIYYLVFYNRVLSAAEITANATFFQQAMNQRGVLITTGATDSNDTLFAVGDSITEGSGALPWSSLFKGLTGTWQVTNQSIAGILLTDIATNRNLLLDPGYRATATRSAVIIFAGTNDVSTGVPAATTSGEMRDFCTTSHAQGWKCLVGTMISRNGQDTAKNALNAYFRQYWQLYADGLVDLAANPVMGADGAYASSTWFQGDGIHPTTMGQYNALTYMFQVATNRLYGPNDFSTATVYTTVAPAAATVSNASQTMNIMTFTTSSAHGFSPGQCVSVAGVTPVGYNSPSGQCWYIITTPLTTTFTAWNNTTGLGALSVAGVASVPLQADQDKYITLGGSAAGQNMTLETCMGYTGQNLYLRNIDANAWTVTPFASETINGAASVLIPSGGYLSLQAILTSAAAGGCGWGPIPNTGVLVRAADCGTSAACSSTTMANTKIVIGDAQLNGASPSLVTITGMSPAFTSNTSYHCVQSDSTATSHYDNKITYVSGTSFTITSGQNGLTDLLHYICVGQ